MNVGSGEPFPPTSQMVDEKPAVELVNKIAGLTNNVVVNAETETKNNSGDVLVLHICRSSTIAMTSSGKIFIRIGDHSIPVTSS